MRMHAAGLLTIAAVEQHSVDDLTTIVGTAVLPSVCCGN